MSQIVEGSLEAKGLKVALVAARFNDVITGRLIAGAEDCLERHGCGGDLRTVIRVPGCFELPFVVRKAALGGRFDAVIALGALVRGETAHYDVLAAAVTRGLGQVALEAPVPVVFGVLTTDSVEQAVDRAGAKLGNKGWDAALAAIEMANLCRRLS